MNTPPKITSYEQFIDELSKGTAFDDYYEYLLIFANDIILDIAYSSQGAVAKRLNMSPAKFSSISSLSSCNLLARIYRCCNKVSSMPLLRCNHKRNPMAD